MPAGAENYRAIRDSGLLNELTAAGKVIETREIEVGSLCEASGLTGFGERPTYLLEHPKLPFISYPYEWCFSALKSAALLQLDLLSSALERGFTMSDASAFNFQFVGTKPILIDVLSFRPYHEGEHWHAHSQFCEQFVNPLLLSSLKGVPFNNWLRGNLEGIPTQDLARLLGWKEKLSWNVMAHVVLPTRFQATARDQETHKLEAAKKRPFPKSAFANMVAALRRWIERLPTPRSSGSDWATYSVDNSYSNEEAQAKLAFIRRFSEQTRPSLLWDLGCNVGVYSQEALAGGAQSVVGFDFDLNALELAFENAERNNLALQPLFLDAANPSPGQGWMGLERKSLQQRGPADGVIALAFIHHLAIGRNIPLNEVLKWLVSLAPTGVVEFVEKDDPTVQRMLQFREDIFSQYSRDAFLGCLKEVAEIVEQQEITERKRLLVWYRRTQTLDARNDLSLQANQPGHM